MATLRTADASSAILDFELVRSRINTFWGYGNLESDIWLIGMEEGCGDVIDEALVARFKSTATGSVFDITEDMSSDPTHMKWFQNGAATQSTYRKFIFLLLYLRSGKAPTLEEIREYQIRKLGRKSSDHAILELMPLPCRSLTKAHWLYSELGIPELASRKEYLAEYKPKRVEELRFMIQKHKPKLVIFYSRQYLTDWQLVSGAPLQEIIPGDLSIAKDDSTIYAVVPHPTAQGYSNNDWSEIAEAILKYLAYSPLE